MTVQAGPTDKRYAANGVTAAYTIPFLLIKADDLQVYLNDTQVTSGFTLTGLGAPNSTITFNALSIPTGDLYLLLNVPFERLTDYQENGEFRAATVNLDFDRIWQAIKQLGRYASKALSLGVNDIDGQGSYRANNNRIQDVHDPVQNADATNKLWVQQYIGGLLAAGQGPANTAANVLYVRPDGTTQTVQDLSGSDGASGIGWDGRPLSATLKTIRSTDLSASTDKAQALADFAASLNGQRGRVEPGTYIMSKQVNLPGNVDLDLTGVVMDFSAANVANFPDLCCLKPANGSLSLLPALSADAPAGTYELKFNAAHGLLPGRVIVLHNDADFSYSGFRANYQQGQFAVVRSVSGLTVNLTSPLLFTAQAASFKTYAMSPSSPRITGGDIIMPSVGVMAAGFMCDIARRPTIDQMRVYGTSGGGIVFQRTLGGVCTRSETYSDRDGVAADNYGFVLSNSQDCYAVECNFHARRHAVTMGGAAGPGSVPTRFCVIEKCELASWDIQCADMHGNVEHCQYVNCVMQNGVTISGNHNAVRNSTIFAPALASTGNGVAISINEMRGTSFTFENLNIVSYGDPSTTSRGVIDIGGNSNAMTANTVLGGCLSFRNINLSAPNARIPFKCINAGSNAPNKSIIYDVKWNDAPASRTSNFWAGVASGSNFARIDFKGMRFNDVGAPAGITANADFVSGLRETGVATITTVASSGVQNFAVSFTNRFPKAPIVTVTPNRSAPGPLIVTYVSASDANGFTISLIPSSGTTTAGVVINVAWTASLDE